VVPIPAVFVTLVVIFPVVRYHIMWVIKRPRLSCLPTPGGLTIVGFVNT
jgi:hypothetical protein